MGTAELNRLLPGGAHGRPADMNQATVSAGIAHAAASGAGEGTEGQVNWESAWIDLGGEG